MDMCCKETEWKIRHILENHVVFLFKHCNIELADVVPCTSNTFVGFCWISDLQVNQISCPELRI